MSVAPAPGRSVFNALQVQRESNAHGGGHQAPARSVEPAPGSSLYDTLMMSPSHVPPVPPPTLSSSSAASFTNSGNRQQQQSPSQDMIQSLLMQQAQQHQFQSAQLAVAQQYVAPPTAAGGGLGNIHLGNLGNASPAATAAAGAGGGPGSSTLSVGVLAAAARSPGAALINSDPSPGAVPAPAVAAAVAVPKDEQEEPAEPGHRKPIPLFMSCDDEDLSEFQCMVRKQIEVFEAGKEDLEVNARGRNRPIIQGQVGIRCRHCKVVPPKLRQRAALYYPSKLDRLYQMSQTIASVHLLEYCQHIPPDDRNELIKLRQIKSAALGGKKYWADAGRALGLIEHDKRLFYGKCAVKDD